MDTTLRQARVSSFSEWDRPPGSGTRFPSKNHFRFALCSRSRRSAVRFFAAASDAFLARADRSSAVMVAAAFFPPSLPYFLPIAFKYSSTSGGIFAMSLSLHLTPVRFLRYLCSFHLQRRGVRCNLILVLMFD